MTSSQIPLLQTTAGGLYVGLVVVPSKDGTRDEVRTSRWHRVPDEVGRGGTRLKRGRHSEASDYAGWRRAPAASPPPGCSQRRPPALRACRTARRSTLASTAAGRRRTSDAIASTARLRSPWMPSARYSAKERDERACRRAFSGSMASAQLTPVGVCVDILRPRSSNSSRVPEVHEEKTPGQGLRRGESAAGGRSLARADLVTFSGRKLRNEERSKREGERPGRVAESPASLIPPESGSLWQESVLLGSCPQSAPAVKRTRPAPTLVRKAATTPSRTTGTMITLEKPRSDG